MNKLILKAVIFFLLFICVFMLLPAGTWKFWEAWIYAVAIFIPMVITITYLAKNDPALLQRRMRWKEREKNQKKIVGLFRLPFILGFLLPGLDYRYNWSEVPVALILIANGMVLLGYFLVFLVFKENSYTSRIIEVENDQHVISTGPYSFVRHPMYIGMIIMFLFTPIALGSWWALLVFIFLPLVLILRIIDEEKILKRDLSGYEEYCRKTKYRLIPYVW